MRPFDQCLGSKYLFETEVTQVGESTWDAVRSIKVSVFDLAFEQEKYLLSSTPGPGALSDPENSREGTTFMPWWYHCCVTLGK